MGEWKKVKLSDLGRVVTGKTPSTKNEAFWNGSIPFVTPGDIQSTKHIFGTARYVTDEGASAVGSAVLPAGSICVSCIGVIGYVGITTTMSLSNQQINSIVVNQANDRDFVYYLLKSKWDEFKQMEGFSSVVSILNKSTFSDIEACVPNLPTQRRIAAVLGALDDKIEVNRKICENLEAQAQALFKAWFEDFEPFQGVVPEGWKSCVLGDVSQNIRQRVGTESRKVLSAVTTGLLVLSEEYFTKQVFSQDISKYIVVDEGDFAYNPARINIGPIGVNDLGLKGCVSPVYVTVRVDREYLNYFKLFFKTENFNREVNARAIGSVRQTLGYPDFAKIPCVYPDVAFVRRFNEIYESIDLKQRTLMRESRALAAMRDALLPKLMSGELAVEKVEGF